MKNLIFIFISAALISSCEYFKSDNTKATISKDSTGIHIDIDTLSLANFLAGDQMLRNAPAFAKIKKTDNILLSKVEKNIPYVTFKIETYQSDTASARLRSIFDLTTKGLANDRTTAITGVEYTVQSGVVVTATTSIYIEGLHDDFEPAKQWLDENTNAWNRMNPDWTLTPPKEGTGYYGVKYIQYF